MKLMKLIKSKSHCELRFPLNSSEDATGSQIGQFLATIKATVSGTQPRLLWLATSTKGPPVNNEDFSWLAPCSGAIRLNGTEPSGTPSHFNALSKENCRIALNSGRFLLLTSISAVTVLVYVLWDC